MSDNIMEQITERMGELSDEMNAFIIEIQMKAKKDGDQELETSLLVNQWFIMKLAFFEKKLRELEENCAKK